MRSSAVPQAVRILISRGTLQQWGCGCLQTPHIC